MAREALTTIMAYDGQHTRTAYDGRDTPTPNGHLSVQSGRIQNDRIFRPNTFLYAYWNLPVPFSAFLSAQKGEFGTRDLLAS